MSNNNHGKGDWSCLQAYPEKCPYPSSNTTFFVPLCLVYTTPSVLSRTKQFKLNPYQSQTPRTNWVLLWILTKNQIIFQTPQKTTTVPQNIARTIIFLTRLRWYLIQSNAKKIPQLIWHIRRYIRPKRSIYIFFNWWENSPIGTV